MQANSPPVKTQIPFASTGTKNTIPNTSQIGVTPGAASFPDGFPPLTFTPLASGGVPPAGADFNGIFNHITQILQWQSAGGSFKFDSTFSTAVSGYPKGSILVNSSNDGFWVSLIDGNTSDPNIAGTTSWAPLSSAGAVGVSVGASNVTLTPSQYAKKMIIFTGAITANIQVTFPTINTDWQVVNSTSGAFTLSVKLATGSAIPITAGAGARIFCDGATLFNYPIDLASGTVAVTPTAGDRSKKVATAEMFSTEFLNNPAGQGSVRFPNGIILNWGSGTSNAGGNLTVSFDRPNTAATYIVIPSLINSGAGMITVSGVQLNSATFNFWQPQAGSIPFGAGITMHYFVIGK